MRRLSQLNYREPTMKPQLDVGTRTTAMSWRLLSGHEHGGRCGGREPAGVRRLAGGALHDGGLLVMAVLATSIAFLARQAGTEQAIQSAQQVAWVTARGMSSPR